MTDTAKKTVYDYRPETALEMEIWRQGRGQDPARYLVRDSNLYHRRPSLQSGNLVFVFPVGVEGMRHTGQATLAIHHYFGDDDAEVQILHKDESRIELSGTLPGIRGVESMAALRILIRDTPPDIGKILFLPGIYERVQYVVVESYDFTHAADDRTHSWDYVITFVRTGAGRRLPDPHGKPPPPNPGTTKTPRGKYTRFWRTGSGGARTFRQISKIVYGSASKWKLLVDLNNDLINSERQRLKQDGIASFDIPNFRWSLGTKIYY